MSRVGAERSSVDKSAVSFWFEPVVARFAKAVFGETPVWVEARRLGAAVHVELQCAGSVIETALAARPGGRELVQKLWRSFAEAVKKALEAGFRQEGATVVSWTFRRDPDSGSALWMFVLDPSHSAPAPRSAHQCVEAALAAWRERVLSGRTANEEGGDSLEAECADRQERAAAGTRPSRPWEIGWTGLERLLREAACDPASLVVAHLAQRLAVKAGVAACELPAIRAGVLLRKAGWDWPAPSVWDSHRGPVPAASLRRRRSLQPAEAHLGRPTLSRITVEIVRHHREWYDGTGYPDGLKGEEIPLAARIVALADAFGESFVRGIPEAFDPRGPLEAMRPLVGSRFDPGLYQWFLEVVEETDWRRLRRALGPMSGGPQVLASNGLITAAELFADACGECEKRERQCPPVECEVITALEHRGRATRLMERVRLDRTSIRLR